MAWNPAFRREPLSYDRESLFWSTGVEDTFIATPHRKTGRILDEYHLTEHYTKWREDLRLAADLGVKLIRYGVPWYRICASEGKFDWSWTDEVLEFAIGKLGLEPVIDLVHYGTPLWMERSFLNPAYPEYVAEYAGAFAERYRHACYWYTPLNEPRVNAWYAGKLGWWPPYGKSWRSFVQVLLQIVKGICLTRRIAEIEPRAVFVHVDASDLYIPSDASEPALDAESRLRQEIVYLSLDAAMGRITPMHPLYEWLLTHGVSHNDIEWLTQHRVTPSIVGFNMYPMFSRKEVLYGSKGRMEVVIRRCWTETLEAITRQYAARYDPLPLMITETASSGSMKTRLKWIEESTELVHVLRADDIPLIGYVFWPLFSLVTWAYQGGKRDLEKYILHMGLYDLKPGPEGLQRVNTPAVSAYRSVIASGAPDEKRDVH
jgi:beta-glucosidase